MFKISFQRRANMRRRALTVLLALLLLMGSATFFLVSCGGGGGGSGGSSSTGSSGTGTVAVTIADNPTKDYDAINVYKKGIKTPWRLTKIPH